jgi:hypothetical protein
MRWMITLTCPLALALAIVATLEVIVWRSEGRSVLKASPRRLGGGLTPRRLARLPRLGVQAVLQRFRPPYRFKNHGRAITPTCFNFGLAIWYLSHVHPLIGKPLLDHYSSKAGHVPALRMHQACCSILDMLLLCHRCRGSPCPGRRHLVVASQEIWLWAGNQWGLAT